jgi:hypothetical protein
VVTEGNGLNYKNNIVPRAVTDLTGLRDGVAVGLNQKRDQVHARILAELARRMNATVAGRWQAMGATGAAVVYMGVVLAGIAAAQVPPMTAMASIAGIMLHCSE